MPRLHRDAAASPSIDPADHEGSIRGGRHQRRHELLPRDRHGDRRTLDADFEDQRTSAEQQPGVRRRPSSRRTCGTTPPRRSTGRSSACTSTACSTAPASRRRRSRARTRSRRRRSGRRRTRPGSSPGPSPGPSTRCGSGTSPGPQAQIQATMNAELTSGTGLLGRWGMNEGSGTTATGSVGDRQRRAHGGGPTWVARRAGARGPAPARRRFRGLPAGNGGQPRRPRQRQRRARCFPVHARALVPSDRCRRPHADQHERAGAPIGDPADHQGPLRGGRHDGRRQLLPRDRLGDGPVGHRLRGGQRRRTARHEPRLPREHPGPDERLDARGRRPTTVPSSGSTSTDVSTGRARRSTRRPVRTRSTRSASGRRSTPPDVVDGAFAGLIDEARIWNVARHERRDPGVDEHRAHVRHRPDRPMGHERGLRDDHGAARSATSTARSPGARPGSRARRSTSVRRPTLRSSWRRRTGRPA